MCIRDRQEPVAYVKARKQFGRSISAFQNTQFELAEMKARIEAAKYLVYAAALKKQEAMNGAKVRYSVEAAEAKLIAARTASDVTRRCLQLFGGYGSTCLLYTSQPRGRWQCPWTGDHPPHSR